MSLLSYAYRETTTKLHQLGDKTVRAGPKDCWNWTVSLDINDDNVESKYIRKQMIENVTDAIALPLPIDPLP